MSGYERPPGFHASHALEIQDWDGAEPHTPRWVCVRCEESECALCARPKDIDLDNELSELAEPCRGYPSWEAVTVKVGKDKTIQARRSGVGWFLWSTK